MLLLAPLMLIGLGAIAAPIIIHLLDKSRSATQEWPTLRFMRIANRQANRRSKLKNWIVLAVRCLLIALVVLAMAKPYSTAADFSRPQDLPTTLVIVLDNSFSMGYRDGSAGGGDTSGDAKPGDASASDESTRFAKARKLVAEQIEHLGNEDEVALILANENPVTLTDRPTRDRDAVAKLAREAKLTSRGTNMSAALAAAFAVGNLDADDKAGSGEQPAGAAKPKRKSWRQVLVVTDMQASAWRSLIDSKLIEQVKDAIPVTVVDISGGDTSNRFIRQTRLRDEMSGGTLSVEVEVAGRSSLRGGGDLAELYIDGQKAGNPEPIPQTGGKLVLRAPAPPPGPHACRVVLSGDRLPIDDRSYFAINVAAGRSLTVVDGDPSDVATLAGAFYFDTAISLGQGKPGAPELQRLTAAQLSTASLTPGGCLVLINVPTLDGSALNKVENYLRAGGNVVVALGDKVNVDHYNNDWRFLPVKLDRMLGDSNRSRTYGVVVQKADHPIFGGAIDLAATRYFAFVGSDPTTIKPGGGVLASFSNGSPMMIESTYGGASPGSGGGEGGRVLLVTGSLDARWSNLPFRRAFVPLIDRVVNYMTRGRTTSASLTLGQPMRFTGPGTLDRQTVTVTAPDGSKQTLTAALDAKTGQAAADYRDTTLPGIYRVQANEGFGTGGAFAVNVDTRESILTPQDPQELTKAFGALPLRLVKTPPADLAKWNPLEDDSEREKRTEYWPWLLLAALLVFAIETALSNYFTRRRRALPPPTTEYLATRRGETLATRA